MTHEEIASLVCRIARTMPCGGELAVAMVAAAICVPKSCVEFGESAAVPESASCGEDDQFDRDVLDCMMQRTGVSASI